MTTASAPRRLPLEKASKEQILDALKNEFWWPDMKDRLESRLYHDKIKSLIDETGLLLKEAEQCAQVSGERFDVVKATRWMAIMDKIDRISARISKLQGT